MDVIEDGPTVTVTSKEYLDSQDIAKLLQEFGTGFRGIDDPLFVRTDELHPQTPISKLGIFSNGDEEVLHKQFNVSCNVPGCRKEFETVYGYESHYNSMHRYLCSQCRKNLPSAHLLDLHLSEKHDSFFAVQSHKKPMFVCYIEECKIVSQTSEERKNHCITSHKFPHNFRFDNYSTKKSAAPAEQKHASAEPMAEDDENGPAKKDPPVVPAEPPVKPMKLFNFGHSKQKTFRNEHNYARALTIVEPNVVTQNVDILENNKMVDDLMECLPE